jgi:2'-5' RNA ligase
VGAPRGGEAEPSPKRRRVFFALWPDAACRERLEATAQRALSGGAAQAGRHVPPADWHVTLCFLGAVQESLLPVLQAAAARLHAPAFALRFERLLYWRQAGVLALMGDCPPQATALAAALRTLARELGLTPDDKPLRPHITLVRGLRGVSWQVPRGTALELLFPATRFELVESRENVAAPAARYRALVGWPLEG